jgi:signal transduction histidine kinase
MYRFRPLVRLLRLPRLRLPSLYARLVAAFTLVIFLTLLLAGGATVWLIQDYRTRIEVNHLAELATVASGMGRQLERQDARPEEIAAFVASELRQTNVHVLVLDPGGMVLAERPQPPEGAVFVGRSLAGLPAAAAIVPAPSLGTGRSLAPAKAAIWRGTLGSDRSYVLVTAILPTVVTGSGDGRPEGLERFFARPASYRVVLAVPSQNLASAWRELAPRLALAGLAAVPCSIAVALWLARSIARPLRRITQAAERIARGEWLQTVPVRGTDEIARLGQAFNLMSREVERSHRTLRQFVANASHELRTPLTSIQGFSQALAEGAIADPGEAIEAGAIINDEAQRMRRLVEDLLYLSRVESAVRQPAHEPVDLGALLLDEERRMRPAIAARRVRLLLELPELPPVLGDEDELDHLFTNLLDNAAKYTPEGGTITVRAQVDEACVQVTVHNTGSYIPEEDRLHLFERFYRVDKSRAREVDGSGLGLAIAHEVAQRHGGTITVESDPQQGTAFVVTLPLGSVGAEEGRRVEPARPPGRWTMLFRRAAGAAAARLPGRVFAGFTTS